MTVECHTTFTDPGATATDSCAGSVAVTASGTVDPNTPGTYVITYSATDGTNTAMATRTVRVVDTTPPVITCPANITVAAPAGTCSAVVTFTVTATDTCSGALTPTVTPASGSTFAIGTTTVNASATDGSGNTSTCSFTVTVTKPSPVVTITGPASGSIFAVGTAISLTGSFTDAGGGTHTATWTVGSTNIAGTVNESTGAVTATFTPTAAGVYFVSLTVTNNCGQSGTANTVGGLSDILVIFDPSAGFVTGGGWINSPAGALVSNPTVTGKANFGFNAKYHGTTPDGQAEFQFQSGNFNFHATSVDVLVVTPPKAFFTGSGTVNGAGSFGFTITVIDGSQTGGGGVDKFRIKVWDKNQGNAVVYDTQPGAPDTADPTTTLGGGSIHIHN
jgi:hypothetical protein